MEHQGATSPDAKSQDLSRKERRQLKEQARLEELAPLQQRLLSEDADSQLEAARELRSMLESAHPPHLDDVIHAGFVPRLLQLSQVGERHELQFEALWVLTNLTSGTAEQTHAIVDNNAVDIFEHLLASPVASTREQAVTLLANIAGASVELRDSVIRSGAATYVMRMLNGDKEVEQQTYYDEAEKVWKLRAGRPEQPIAVTRMAARCFSCLCRGEPRPEFGEATRPLLHTLETLVMSTDEEVLANACLALSYLEYCTPERVASMIKDGVCARLVELLSYHSCEVRSFAARAAEKIATGSSQGMEAVLQCKPMPALKQMMSTGEPAIQRDSCSIVADILALGQPQLQEAIDAGCVPLLIRLLHSGDDDTKRCATRAVAVLSSKCSPEQMVELIGPDCVAPMVAMLEMTAFQSGSAISSAALDFLENILRAGKSIHTTCFVQCVKDADGLRMLQVVKERSVDEGTRTRATEIVHNFL